MVGNPGDLFVTEVGPRFEVAGEFGVGPVKLSEGCRVSPERRSGRSGVDRRAVWLQHEVFEFKSHGSSFLVCRCG